MKTALKIIGGIFATLILAVVVFYVGWLMPPSADDVCDNVVKVTKAEAEKAGATLSDGDLSGLEAQCKKAATKEPEFGKGVWVKKLKCMRDAADGAALQKCDEIKSM